MDSAIRCAAAPLFTEEDALSRNLTLSVKGRLSLTWVRGSAPNNQLLPYMIMVGDQGVIVRQCLESYTVLLPRSNTVH